MKSGIYILFIVTLIFGGGYWYVEFQSICSLPMAYRIGTIDERFNISREDVKEALAVAESIWEVKTGKDIFNYSESGKLVVNLVYDERQEYVNEEEQLRATLANKENMSESVRVQYESLLGQYGTLKKTYENRVALYERHLSAYNAEVAEWNTKGGAPQDVFNRLKKTEDNLAEEQSDLNTIASSLNTMVQKMNAISAKGNSLITDYNQVVKEYNNKFTEGHEFTQGDYQTKVINIYQYDSLDELEIVLAHELGHALSLQHVEGSTSVMYHLMEAQTKATGLTPPDITEFNRVCGNGNTISGIVTTIFERMFNRS